MATNMPTEEYLRRNLLHASSVGVKTDIEAAMKRLVNRRAGCPKWLLKLLTRAHVKAYNVSKEMCSHRDEILVRPR